MMRLVYSRTNTYQLLLIRPNTLQSVPIALIGTYTLIVQRKQIDGVYSKRNVRAL